MKQRIIGLDLIRCIAVLFVVSVHFFLNCDYYFVNIVGTKMIVATAFRWLFFVCVPLFLLLTGYLQNKKKLTKSFYKGIIPVLSSYLIISIISILFRVFYLHEEKSIVLWIVSILDFTADEYSWYIEMFIGIFLLIPFLNVVYNGLKTQKEKLILIGTILTLTTLASFLSVTFGSYSEYKLFPEFWQGLFPFAYYFMGAYISEFGVKLKKSSIAMLLVLVLVYQTWIEYYKSAGQPFLSDKYNAYNALPTVAISVLLFLLLYNVDIKNKAVCFVVSDISKASLDIYLASYIFDKIAYPILKEKVPVITDRFAYYFVVVPIVFVCAYILSCIRRLAFLGVKKIIPKQQEKVLTSA